MKPARVSFPGHLIKRELIAHGWTRRDLAEKTGLSKLTVNKIIQGNSPITVEIAERLGEAFGTSAEMWVNLYENNQRPTQG